MAEPRLSIVIDSRSAEQKAQDVKRAAGALGCRCPGDAPRFTLAQQLWLPALAARAACSLR